MIPKCSCCQKSGLVRLAPRFLVSLCPVCDAPDPKITLASLGISVRR